MLLQVIQNSHEFLFSKKIVKSKGDSIGSKKSGKESDICICYFDTTSFPEYSEKIRQIETEFDLLQKIGK